MPTWNEIVLYGEEDRRSELTTPSGDDIKILCMTCGFRLPPSEFHGGLHGKAIRAPSGTRAEHKGRCKDCTNAIQRSDRTKERRIRYREARKQIMIANGKVIRKRIRFTEEQKQSKWTQREELADRKDALFKKEREAARNGLRFCRMCYENKTDGEFYSSGRIKTPSDRCAGYCKQCLNEKNRRSSRGKLYPSDIKRREESARAAQEKMASWIFTCITCDLKGTREAFGPCKNRKNRVSKRCLGCQEAADSLLGLGMCKVCSVPMNETFRQQWMCHSCLKLSKQNDRAKLAQVELREFRAKPRRAGDPPDKRRLERMEKRWERLRERWDGTVPLEQLSTKIYPFLEIPARCPYCDCKITRGCMALDHIHPLSGRGFHGFVNLLVCCHECNTRKHAQPLHRWIDCIKPSLVPAFIELYEERFGAHPHQMLLL